MTSFLLIFAVFLSLASANYDKLKFDAKESNFIIPDDTETSLLNHFASKQGRIVNGAGATDFDYPYAVELTVRWRNGQFQTCTGAILSTSYIITARKCLFDDLLGQTAATVMIHAGASCRCRSRTAIFTQWATWLDRTDGSGDHPNFGLTLLSQYLVTSPTIQPIRLPTADQSLSWFDLTPMWLCGWGLTQSGVSDVLQHGRVVITAKAQNKEQFIPDITEYELLASTDSQFPGLLLTDGSQGGPMVFDEAGVATLIGTLWTNRFYNDGVTAQYMVTAFRIGHFWDFIHDVTGIVRRN